MSPEIKQKLEKMLHHLQAIEIQRKDEHKMAVKQLKELDPGYIPGPFDNDEITLDLYNVGRWDFEKDMLFTKDDLWVSVNRSGYYLEQDIRVTFDISILKSCFKEALENKNIEILKEGLSTDWEEFELINSGEDYYEYVDDIVDSYSEYEIDNIQLSESWKVDNEDTIWENREINVQSFEMIIDYQEVVIELFQ